MATGIGTTAQVSSKTSDAQVLLQGALGLSTSNASTKQQRIIDSLNDEITRKKQQKEEISDILLLQDIDLDMYDELIVNIDKKIPPLISAINTKIAAVDAAYEARITGDGRSDLTWTVESTQTVNKVGGGSVTTTKYKVTKNSTRAQINRYGAKYRKRPKDRDYGASAVTEIPDASVGIGSTYMVVNNPNVTNGTFDGLRDIQINDTITDSIEQPTIFTIGDLPEAIGFGSTSILGIKTTFEGTISLGSTVLAFTGGGSTASISIGDRIWRTGVTSTDSVVTGFGTGTVSVIGIGTTGESVTFTIDTTTILLDKVSVASTSEGTFNVGIYTSYPLIFLNETSATGATNENFHVIRNTGSDENFDPATSGENPVEVGTIVDDNKTGYGHVISLINNGDPQTTKTYIEDVDPDPAVGAGFVEYYVGDFSWPGKNTPVYGGIGGTSIIGYTFAYASEGDTASVVVGVGTSSTVTSSGIAYTSTGPSNPSTATKNALDAAISTAESELTSIKNTNLPIINDYISKSASLRSIRDKKQSQAWNYRRARGSIVNDLKELEANSKSLSADDLSEFEG